MKNLLLGFMLGLVVATAGFVSAQGFVDLESGTMFQQVPGGLLNMSTGELRLTTPLGQSHQLGQRRPPC
jgi:hypothetical protein